MSNQTGCHQFSLLLSLSYLENVKAQLAEITETKPKKEVKNNSALHLKNSRQRNSNKYHE